MDYGSITTNLGLTGWEYYDKISATAPASSASSALISGLKLSDYAGVKDDPECCKITVDKPAETIKPKNSFDKYIPDNISIFNENTIVFDYGKSKIKTTAADGDEFDFIHGIEICLLKKLLGGTSNYNKLVRACAKKYKDIEKKKIADEMKKKEEELIRKNRYIRNQKKKAKQKEKSEKELMKIVSNIINSYNKGDK